jgi:hypothetical protein
MFTEKLEVIKQIEKLHQGLSGEREHEEEAK